MASIDGYLVDCDFSAVKVTQNTEHHGVTIALRHLWPIDLHLCHICTYCLWCVCTRGCDFCEHALLMRDVQCLSDWVTNAGCLKVSYACR